MNIHTRTKTFPIQSFLSDAAGARAILPQSAGQPIVAAQTVQVRGQVIALHPGSATPIAVRVKTAKGAQNGNVFILTPGSVIRPIDGIFDGLEWGLPFGWLGGGVATLLICDAKDATFDWASARREVLFHRFRTLIAADGAAANAIPLSALPARFPWNNAERYVAAASFIPQKGDAVLEVRPTRIVARLRSYLTAPATMRVLVGNNDDAMPFGSGAETTYADVDWPGMTGITSQGFPITEILGPIAKVCGDTARLTLTDASGAAALAGLYVDLLRYGEI